jgi:hypothetical protein
MTRQILRPVRNSALRSNIAAHARNLVRRSLKCSNCASPSNQYHQFVAPIDNHAHCDIQDDDKAKVGNPRATLK